MAKIKGKSFKLILVDIDYFDSIREYLKRSKKFSYGLAVFTKTQKNFNIIYMYIKYDSSYDLNTEELYYCRISKNIKITEETINQIKQIGEVIWEEGKINKNNVKYKQKCIDDFLKIENQFSVYLK